MILLGDNELHAEAAFVKKDTTSSSMGMADTVALYKPGEALFYGRVETFYFSHLFIIARMLW